MGCHAKDQPGSAGRATAADPGMRPPLACFSRNRGFDQTGMAEEIVRHSGLSHGAVYGYFPSKDDIIAALADDRHQREALLTAAALDAGDSIEGLHRLVRAYAAWLNDPAAAAAGASACMAGREALRSDRVHARW